MVCHGMDNNVQMDYQVFFDTVCFFIYSKSILQHSQVPTKEFRDYDNKESKGNRLRIEII